MSKGKNQQSQSAPLAIEQLVNLNPPQSAGLLTADPVEVLQMLFDDADRAAFILERAANRLEWVAGTIDPRDGEEGYRDHHECRSLAEAAQARSAALREIISSGRVVFAPALAARS